MLFGEYINRVHEMDFMNTLQRLFGAARDQQFGCITVFDKLKRYYQEFKDADKDPIEQVISVYIDEDDKKYFGSHIINYKNGCNYSMYNKPWKLLPFHEVEFENYDITPEEVVAIVIWEITWWGFNEPEYEGLTFHFITDINNTITPLNMRTKKTFFFADRGDYLYTYDKENHQVRKVVIKYCSNISTRVRVYQTKLGTFNIDFTNSRYYTDFGDIVVAVSKYGLRRWIDEIKGFVYLEYIHDVEALIKTYR